MEIEYKHFPLHPDTPEEGLTLEQLFAGRQIDVAASQAKIAQSMADEGLPYGDRTMTYNSRLAQELGAWATSEQKPEIHDALFQAYFVDNVNLAIVDNLIEIAGQVGLSKQDAERVLQERLFRDPVDADWRRSRELGITGIPTFVWADRMLVGAQPYQNLEALVRSAH